MKTISKTLKFLPIIALLLSQAACSQMALETYPSVTTPSTTKTETNLTIKEVDQEIETIETVETVEVVEEVVEVKELDQLTAPESVTATQKDPFTVEITWQETEQDSDSYDIFLMDEHTNESYKIGSTEEKEFTANGLYAGETYNFYVQGIQELEEETLKSEASLIASITLESERVF